MGLGGRLDSTNIITPLVSVITNIGYDHKKFLGNSLAEIAREKAGIFKTNVPVVIGESNDITNEIFNNYSKKVKTNIFYVNQNHNNYAVFGMFRYCFPRRIVIKYCRSKIWISQGFSK